MDEDYEIVRDYIHYMESDKAKALAHLLDVDIDDFRRILRGFLESYNRLKNKSEDYDIIKKYVGKDFIDEKLKEEQMIVNWNFRRNMLGEFNMESFNFLEIYLRNNNGIR